LAADSSSCINHPSQVAAGKQIERRLIAENYVCGFYITLEPTAEGIALPAGGRSAQVGSFSIILNATAVMALIYG